MSFNSIDILLLVAGACWGSFLNVVATRGIQQISMIPRSHCPHCLRSLAWYELIPLISWLMLRARCRTCATAISAWYPALEGLTALWMLVLYHQTPLQFFPALFLLSSALLVTMRTDSEHLLILRSCTLGIIPCGLGAAYFCFLPISITESITGALVGAGYLMLVRMLFCWWKGYEGLGEGDIELLAAIGSFVGPLAVINIVLVASCLGTAYGITLLVLSRTTTLQTPIPFGTLLALGTGIVLMMSL